MEEDRGEAMALRLERAARRASLADHALRLADTFRAVLRQRAAVIPEPHDPDFLHPGRTALVLLEDLQIKDPDLICAALLHDSERADFRLDEARRIAGPHAAALAAGLPRANDDENRLETLVGLDHDRLLLTIAERLDYARHLHLRHRDTWLPFHRQIGHADLPAAARAHPRLAWRLQWWHDNFARRFLRLPK
jgi:hypothetical protein